MYGLSWISEEGCLLLSSSDDHVSFYFNIFASRLFVCGPFGLLQRYFLFAFVSGWASE